MSEDRLSFNRRGERLQGTFNQVSTERFFFNGIEVRISHDVRNPGPDYNPVSPNIESDRW